jgi:hypothetical protein
MLTIPFRSCTKVVHMFTHPFIVRLYCVLTNLIIQPTKSWSFHIPQFVRLDDSHMQSEQRGDELIVHDNHQEHQKRQGNVRLSYPVVRQGRKGGSWSIFGNSLVFDLSDLRLGFPPLAAYRSMCREHIVPDLTGKLVVRVGWA